MVRGHEWECARERAGTRECAWEFMRKRAGARVRKRAHARLNAQTRECTVEEGGHGQGRTGTRRERDGGKAGRRPALSVAEGQILR